jgi:hypothetical protein
VCVERVYEDSTIRQRRRTVCRCWWQNERRSDDFLVTNVTGCCRYQFFRRTRSLCVHDRSAVSKSQLSGAEGEDESMRMYMRGGLIVLLQYLDEHSSRDESSGQTPGQLYYEAACMKAVNQSIGRAIRHRRDYAAIVLLDERFAKPRIRSQLPLWISSRLAIHDTFPTALVAVRDFFKAHRTL